MYDAGLKSWSLWNPGSRFDEFTDALRPADGGPSAVERRWTRPAFTVPRQELSRLIVARDRSARAAADAGRPAVVTPPAATPDSWALNIRLAWNGMDVATFTAPMMLIPCSIRVSPATVSSQLPPLSAARRRPPVGR